MCFYSCINLSINTEFTRVLFFLSIVQFSRYLRSLASFERSSIISLLLSLVNTFLEKKIFRLRSLSFDSFIIISPPYSFVNGFGKVSIFITIFSAFLSLFIAYYTK